jgi:hypothetical protein
VVPTFYSTVPRREELRHPLSLDHFLSDLDRTVLLGNPGGGKSTLTDKICNLVASYYTSRHVAHRLLTPVHIILRSFGEAKQKNSCSILDFVEETSNSKYQVKPPPGAFEYLLRNGRLLVIFDGLDELLDTTYRREISSDVESFSGLYPSAPILVTSRQVGYFQAPLDRRRFRTLTLGEFDEEHVVEYAKKWFATYEDLPTADQDRRSTSFIEESRIFPDLRSNPLMLALMCNIYRGESYIPRNRPEVYEKCANMLFERWDKSRGIRPSLPFETHIGHAMKYLAHWLYTEDQLQNGVTYDKIVQKTTEYLCQWLYEDETLARSAAEEFVDFCKGRAWVFTDVGSTPDGLDLYQFTHRTFLEYFTAAHLVRTTGSPERLDAVLRGRIGRREWDVVAQLAYQLLNERLEGAGDTLLGLLLQHGQAAPSERKVNYFSFAARALQFMVPRPATVRSVVKQCLDWVVETRGQSNAGTVARDWSANHAGGELLAALLHAASDNRPSIREGLRSGLVSRLQDNPDVTARMAAEVVVTLPTLPHFGGSRETASRDVLSFAEEIGTAVSDQCQDRIYDLARAGRGLAMYLLRLGVLNIQEFHAWYGARGFFREGFVAAIGLWLPPVIVEALSRYWRSLVQRAPDPRSEKDAILGEVDQLGVLLRSSPAPWIDRASASSTFATSWRIDEVLGLRHRNLDHRLDEDSRVMFLEFVAIAVSYEVTRDRIVLRHSLSRYAEHRSDVVRLIMCRSRRDPETEERLLNELNLDQDSAALMRQWVKRRVSFTSNTPVSSDWMDESNFLSET